MAVYRQANRSNFRIHVSGVEGRVVTNTSISSGSNIFQTHTELRRDYSAWYHVLHVIDTTQSTSTNRVRTWFNNVEDNNASWSFPSQNFTTDYNSTEVVRIGYDDGELLGGYLAEFHWLDGQVIWDPGQFGEYDNAGVWRPKEASGLTYGTNGFYLKFDPSATNGIGHDHSGNGNHFTATNFTTSGTGTDVMSDTPTNNFATLNPLHYSAVSGSSVSNGNLYFSNSSQSAYASINSTLRVPATGKYYFEFTLGFSGLNNTTQVYLSDGAGTSWVWAHASGTSKTYYSGSEQSTEGNTSSGTVCAYAINNGQIRLYRGNSLIHTWSQGASGYLLAGASASWSNNVTFNFGQRPFTYTPPADHVSWCTANLPTPDVANGSDNFNARLWTGTGNEVAVTGYGFQPDFVWVKARSRGSDHRIQDSVRGTYRYMSANLSSGENTNSSNDWFRSFDSDGFTVAQYTSGGTSTSEWAGNGDTYVGWGWLANGSSTTSNTSGSITSNVSANATAGFSIVTWTGTSSVQTVGHGLGVTPAMVVVKNRDHSYDWYVGHKDLTSYRYRLSFNSTNGEIDSASAFNSTSPTSTVFTVGNNLGSNGSADNMIAYCFAEVDGYSHFGKYTGNGSSNGIFQWCGFRPKFVMIKCSSVNGEPWLIFDTVRSTYNVTLSYLVPNAIQAEVSDANTLQLDLLSNGFKLRSSGGNINGNGRKYTFMAIAENPFGGDGVSPVTAR